MKPSRTGRLSEWKGSFDFSLIEKLSDEKLKAGVEQYDVSKAIEALAEMGQTLYSMTHSDDHLTI